MYLKNMHFIVFLTCVCQIFSMAGFAAWPIYLLDLQKEWLLTNSEAGWISGSFFLGYVIATPFLVGLTDIYDSRTFCLFEDIENLRSLGYAKGGSLDNAIVVKNNKILNDESLRNNLEFVNHKILDCMGDLYLTGYKIVGKLNCSQGGHKLTNDLLRKVFSDQNNYSIVEINEKTIPHAIINKTHLRSIA